MIRLFNTFTSIQGESTHAGLPCFFIRLSGCPLRCSYCDTRAACEAEGFEEPVETLVDRFRESGVRRVEVTGGEPLAQPDCGHLLSALCDTGADVLLETGGSISVADVDPRVQIIMDVKCPDSLMNDRMNPGNIELLSGRPHELKFVISSKRDFDWTVSFVRDRQLTQRVLLVSPVPGKVPPDATAEWILESGVDFRLQLQLHKLIWPDGGENR